MYSIEIKQLEKRTGDFRFGPIDLEFEPDTVTAFIGENGSGKSTLEKLIMNLIRRDGGEIYVNGTETGGPDENWKKTISYMPQTIVGCNFLTGKDLKELISKWYPTWDEQLFQHLVQLFDLPLNKQFGKLSQGVQQKLFLALVLARDSDILILDEPTAYIDIPARELLMDELVHWMERGNKTMIIATHQADHIRKLADYLVLFQNGKIIGKFEKEELVGKYVCFWLNRPLPPKRIPGEIGRKGEQVVISQCHEETEQFFKKENIKWMEKKALGLEEAITLLLKGRS